MARMRKSLFLISGALGDIVFKEVDGEQILSTRPVPFMPGTDEASVKRREKFGMVSQICKSIASEDYIKSAWKLIEKRPPYRQLFSANYHNFNLYEPPEKLLLVPENGFDLTVNGFSLSESELIVKTAALGDSLGIDPEVEIRMAMIGFIYMSDPVEEDNPKAAYLMLLPDKKPLDLLNNLEFLLTFKTSDTQIYNEYKIQKAYCALVITDSSGKVIHYSKNIC